MQFLKVSISSPLEHIVKPIIHLTRIVQFDFILSTYGWISAIRGNSAYTMVPNYAQVYLISFLYTAKYAQVCTSYTALSASSDAWPSGVFTIWLSTDLTHSSYFCDFENWNFEKQENLIFFKHWLFIMFQSQSYHTRYDSYRAFNSSRNNFSFSMIFSSLPFPFSSPPQKYFFLL